MVNFFIGRPIFATVLALLLLLIGGICIFVLPLSLYPDIVPPQVQVTATYTGADAQTVADSVTTPIEQKINGVNGMIYMSSDSTSNGVSRILVTLDVGYSRTSGPSTFRTRSIRPGPHCRRKSPRSGSRARRPPRTWSAWSTW